MKSFRQFIKETTPLLAYTHSMRKSTSDGVYPQNLIKKPKEKKKS